MRAIDDGTWEDLYTRACTARSHAHAPYSGYRVGAALLTADGSMFSGCNVENASYGLTVCAERTAIASMIASGTREPIAIVIVTQGLEPGSPCGMCRQVLAEFALDLPIRLVALGPPAKVRDTFLEALLPDAFRAATLEASRVK